MSTSAKHLPGRLLFLLIALMATFLLLGGTVSANQPTITMEHRVRSGDTLWDIAHTITASGADVRGSVEMIRELNGLADSELRPGQVLMIPVG